MDIPIQNKIEKSVKGQFSKVLEKVRACSPSDLTSKAKVDGLSAAVRGLVDPSKWLDWSEPGDMRGMARNLDMVVGYDYHMISLLLPPIPFPLILGPFPIPFISIITPPTPSTSLKAMARRRQATLTSKPVYIDGRLALSGPQEVTSLIPHFGPLPFIPIITIIGGKRRPRCQVLPSEECNVFINGKRAVRRFDGGAESCGTGKIIMFTASGSVEAGTTGGKRLQGELLSPLK